MTHHLPVSDPGQGAFSLCALLNFHFSRREVSVWLTPREDARKLGGSRRGRAGALCSPGGWLRRCFGKDGMFVGESWLSPHDGRWWLRPVPPLSRSPGGSCCSSLVLQEGSPRMFFGHLLFPGGKKI